MSPSVGTGAAAVRFPLESTIYLRAKIHHVGVVHKCFPCGLLNPYTNPVLMLNVVGTVNVSTAKVVLRNNCLYLERCVTGQKIPNKRKNSSESMETSIIWSSSLILSREKDYACHEG